MFPKMKLRVTLTIKGEQTDFFLRSQALIIQLLTEKGTKEIIQLYFFKLKGWLSGESTHLPPMWSRFDSQS